MFVDLFKFAAAFSSIDLQADDGSRSRSRALCPQRQATEDTESDEKKGNLC